jgi:hypothetical protein
MSHAPDLRDVRKRTAQLTNYEDGLWDILLGGIFMLLAVYPITRARLGPTRNLGLFVGLMLVAAGLQLLVRQTFTVPRLGYVKTRRSAKLKALMLVTILLVALTAALVVYTLLDGGWLGAVVPSSGPIWLRTFLVDIVVMGVLVGLFSALGYLFGVGRLYLYGWLLGGSNLTAAVLYDGAPEGFNLPLGLASAVILAIGGALLVRFCRNYPIQIQDA